MTNTLRTRLLALFITGAVPCFSQLPQKPTFRAGVDMVVQTFTVTDSGGQYIRGLKSADLKITEDGIPQEIVTFTEAATCTEAPEIPAEGLEPSGVFVLFDTSDWMYKGLAQATDAVADFIRRLDSAVSVAVYGFSRNLFRAAALTRDHNLAVGAVRSVVVGQATAMYNAVLLTLRDAAKQKGHKAIVVFSNGPDNASILSPDDVAAVGEDEGIPIFIVSTRGPKENGVAAQALARLTEQTGGRLFFANDWRKQDHALSEIRDHFASTYTVAYYPAPNPNRGFRKIAIALPGRSETSYQVETRSGYHPRPDPAQ